MKSKFNTWVETEILNNFRKFAVMKHGKTHGSIGTEVEIALKNYLEAEGWNSPPHKE